MADQVPPGVNMPKKRDPRLRQMQAPQQQKFFDSADYEVRKQQRHQHQHTSQPQPQPQHNALGQATPNGNPRRAPAVGPHPGDTDGNAPRGTIPPPPPSDRYAAPRAPPAPT
ncbi:hypothetical protein LSCM1_01849 [Leishmania martiniquensis]|uniref:Uncharacterized protein n=1 Tax=Leishmania martiniquensis TaxID=1580590 RepID=A0A836KLZ3_9TRYP|nr:hypothetical protein LSCM1_01849 [Leishmania martiniquensis]